MRRKDGQKVQTTKSGTLLSAEFKTKLRIKKSKNLNDNDSGLNVGNISIKKIKNANFTNLKPGKTDNVFKVTILDTKNYSLNLNEGELESGMLRRASSFVKNNYRKRKALYQLLFVFLNFFVILGILLYQKNTLGVMSINEFFSLEKNSYMFLLYAFGIFLFIMLLETFRTHILILQATKANRPLVSVHCTLISKYYDSIIPVFGGKPFELFYLHNKGLKPSAATSVPLVKYLFSLLASVITSTVVIVAKWSFLQESNRIILFLGSLMLVVNLLIVAGMITISVSKKVAPRIVLRTLLVLEKLHIIKDHRARFFKFMRFVLEYQKSVQYFFKNKLISVLSLLASLLISLLKAVIPFVIYAVFATPSWDILLDIMFKYYILTMAINFIPLPGGTGAAEFSFAALFKDYFVSGTLFWAIILWRFFSYYLYLVFGLFGLFADYFTNKKQNKKLAKLNEEILKESKQ